MHQTTRETDNPEKKAGLYKYNPSIGHNGVFPSVSGIDALKVVRSCPQIIKRPFWNVSTSIVVLFTELRKTMSAWS